MLGDVLAAGARHVEGAAAEDQDCWSFTQHSSSLIIQLALMQ